MPSLLSQDKMSLAKRNHEQNRLLICCCCLDKNLKCMPVSTTLEETVQKYCRDNYSLAIESYPAGLCPSCKVQVYKAKAGKYVPTEVLQRWSKSIDIFKPSRNCKACLICEMGRQKPQKKKLQ